MVNETADPEERLRVLVQPTLEAMDDYATMMQATAAQAVPPREETLAPYRAKAQRRAILACARAQAEALRTVPHENTLSAALHNGTDVMPANTGEWMPCPYSPCRQIAAAEALVAKYEGEG